MNMFIMMYGLPTSIVSDQGWNFCQLCELTHINKFHTAPYHPESNGQCERFNSTLIHMLGTLHERDKAHWEDFIPTLVLAYNCT